MSEQRKNRIPLFLLVTTLFWIPIYTYSSIFVPYLESIGTTHRMAGIIVGSYGFTQLILRIPLGALSDKLNKRRVFINLGVLFSFLSATGLLLTKNPNLILIFRSFAGVAAATWIHFNVLFASYYENNKSSEAVGVMSAISNIGQMAAIFLGGLAAEKINWGASFGLGTIAGLAGLMLSFFLVEKFQATNSTVTLKKIIGIASDRMLITISLLAVVSQVITWATVFGFTPVFAELLGATKFEMSLLTITSLLPSAIASIYGSKYLTAELGEKKVVALGFLLMGVFTAIIPFSKSFWLLIVAQIFSGIGRGFSFPALMSLSIKDRLPDSHATAMGFFQAVYGLGMFLGPVAIGVISDIFNLRDGFVALGILGCITAVVSWFVIKVKTGENADKVYACDK